MSDRKKTPSPKVIAAMLFLDVVELAISDGELAEKLTAISDSRVSEDKANKVRVFYDQLTNKLEMRAHRTVGRFKDPPPAKERAKKGGFKKKKPPSEAEPDPRVPF